MRIRKATVNDTGLLIELRIDFLRDMYGELSPEDEEAVRGQLQEYFPRQIAAEGCIAVLAEEEGKAVSTAYLAISEKPANPTFITGITGTLLNVWTYPGYRRRGYAAQVIRRVIEEAREAGVSCIDLSATGEGRALYEKLGFTVARCPAMRMKLDGKDQ